MKSSTGPKRLKPFIDENVEARGWVSPFDIIIMVPPTRQAGRCRQALRRGAIDCKRYHFGFLRLLLVFLQVALQCTPRLSEDNGEAVSKSKSTLVIMFFSLCVHLPAAVSASSWL